MDSSTSTPESPQGDEPKSLVFQVGDDVFACDVTLVREIVRLGRMTRIPGAPAFVRGLLNVRGEVLTVLDVAMRLHPDRGPAEHGSVIVVDVEGRRAGLVVEEVIGVQTVTRNDGESEPSKNASGIAHRMGHLDGQIVLHLDVRAFVSQSLV